MNTELGKKMNTELEVKVSDTTKMNKEK